MRALHEALPLSLLSFMLTFAVAGCGSPPPPTAPVDAELDRASSSARSAFDRGELPEAAMLYGQALTRARALDDPREIADAAYNLAACLMEQSQLGRARELLHEAQWELKQINQNEDDVLLLEAKIAHEQGHDDEALALTDRLLSQPRPKEGAGPSVGVYLLRGRLAIDRHDMGTAIHELAAATAQSKTKDDRTTAGILGLTAQISLEQNKPALAAGQFDSQSQFFAAGGDYGGMGIALARAGNAYLAAGDPARAADRLYRAARCLFSLGQTTQAEKLIEPAYDAAKAANTTSLIDLINALKHDMSSATTRPSSQTMPSLPTEATPP